LICKVGFCHILVNWAFLHRCRPIRFSLPRTERGRFIPLNNCEGCQRLWRDYSHATTDHIRLDSKLRLAALERDSERIAGLTLRVEAAELARSAARDAIRKHEAELHATSEAADTQHP
jgi:hypothetical protein